MKIICEIPQIVQVVRSEKLLFKGAMIDLLLRDNTLCHLYSYLRNCVTCI